MSILCPINTVVLYFLVISVDKDTPMAGGRAKFLNPVTLLYTGYSYWTSTSTFKSSCTVDVSPWPFDKQHCSLLFGSLSQGKHELVIIGGDNRHRGGMSLFRICIHRLKSYRYQFISIGSHCIKVSGAIVE